MKKNNRMLLLLLAAIPLLAFDCGGGKGHNCITFVNNSDSEVHVLERFELISNPSDTFFVCGYGGTILQPGEEFCFEYGIVDRWDDYLSAKPYVQYIVLSKQFKGKCSEETIKEFTEKYQLKRYLLTKEDLDRMNWTVVYPPES